MKETKKEKELSEKLKMLQEDYDALKTERDGLVSGNSSLKETISHKNSEIGGYKASNAQYRQRVSTLMQTEKDLRSQMASLAERLGKAEAYGKEADEIIDAKVAVIDDLNKTIDALNAEIGERKVNYKELEGSYAIACSKIKDLQLDLEIAKRPWWKKFF